MSKLKVVFNWTPPRGLDELRANFPEIEFIVAEEQADAIAQLRDADAACVGAFDAEQLAAGSKLRWIHVMAAGVENSLFPELRASTVPVTCLKGCFATPAAEHAMAMILAFARRLDYDIRRRPHRTFEIGEPEELAGKTLGIIGLGSMGRAIAAKARCFEMRTLGFTRRSQPEPGTVDEFLPGDQLHQLLARSDYVVVNVPLTSATHGFINEQALRAMKPSAYLIDMSGRPAIYDLDALTRALNEGWIAGANLQMVPDPDSALWDVEKLVLTLHRTTSREQFDRCMAFFAENLRRFKNGEPLQGVVDKEAGY